MLSPHFLALLVLLFPSSLSLSLSTDVPSSTDVLYKDIDAHDFQLRAMRGLPWNEYSSFFPDPSVSVYLDSLRASVVQSIASYEIQSSEIRANNGGQLVIPRIDMPEFPPTDVRGRGNYFFSAIHSLEHTVEQLLYLVGKKLLAEEFYDVAMVYKHQLIPEIARGLAPGCVYFNVIDQNDRCPADVRYQYYMLKPAMMLAVSGTHNKLLHLPFQPERTHLHPHALNREVDWAAVQRDYLTGSVVVVDDFLTPHALQFMRELALGSTTFWDIKNGYMGSYLGHGLQSPWLAYMARELQELMPDVIQGLPLRQAWFYKYDNGEETGGQQSRGIKVHADQATVNLNIWITQREANLDPTRGGLIVYNKVPPIGEVEGSFATWNNSTNQESMIEYIGSAQRVRIPYNENRCVLFSSALLHETDEFKFKKGYENRRINLTLLFGNHAAKAAKDEDFKAAYH